MTRDCTCHPSEAPVPCQHRYAYTECRIAALEAENARLREAMAGALAYVPAGRLQIEMLAALAPAPAPEDE